MISHSTHWAFAPRYSALCRCRNILGRIVFGRIALGLIFLAVSGKEYASAQNVATQENDRTQIETGAEAMTTSVSLHRNATEETISLEKAAAIAGKQLKRTLALFGEPDFDLEFVIREAEYKSASRVFPTSKVNDGRKLINVHVRASSFDDSRTWNQINSWWLGQAFPRLLTANQKEGLCLLVEGNGLLPPQSFKALCASRPMALDDDHNPLEPRPRRAGKDQDEWDARLSATRALVCWYWLAKAGAKSPADFPKMKLPDLAQAWKNMQEAQSKASKKSEDSKQE